MVDVTNTALQGHLEKVNTLMDKKDVIYVIFSCTGMVYGVLAVIRD
jgi:hypothetical protein